MSDRDPTQYHEPVHFRLIKCPKCNHLMCWVNPRLPSHCPECGNHIYRQLKFELGHIMISDEKAWLSTTGSLKTVTPRLKKED